jgi:hypothetical protein
MRNRGFRSMMRSVKRGTSMASDVRHAATHHDKRFAVEARFGAERAAVLADGLTDFLDAVDVAMEWVQREDPDRNRDAELAIYSIETGEREQVWAYPARAATPQVDDTRRLVDLFGFDPVTWKPAAREYKAPPNRHPVSASRPVEQHAVELDEVFDDVELDDAEPLDPEPEVEPPTPGERLDAWLASGARIRLRHTLAAFWADRISRWWLIAGAVFLWLGVTLVAPAYFGPLLAVGAGLWLGRGRRARPAATADDWF